MVRGKTDTAAEPKRRGRRPMHAEAKRAAFNTRLRPGLKANLEAAAAANGRSLSEEVEFRLEQSLQWEAMAGGPQHMELLRMLAGTASVVEGGARKSIFQDAKTFLRFLYTWNRLAANLAPHKLAKSQAAFAEEFRTWLAAMPDRGDPFVDDIYPPQDGGARS